MIIIYIFILQYMLELIYNSSYFCIFHISYFIQKNKCKQKVIVYQTKS